MTQYPCPCQIAPLCMRVFPTGHSLPHPSSPACTILGKLKQKPALMQFKKSCCLRGERNEQNLCMAHTLCRQLFVHNVLISHQEVVYAPWNFWIPQKLGQLTLWNFHQFRLPGCPCFTWQILWAPLNPPVGQKAESCVWQKWKNTHTNTHTHSQSPYWLNATWTVKGERWVLKCIA